MSHHLWIGHLSPEQQPQNKDRSDLQFWVFSYFDIFLITCFFKFLNIFVYFSRLNNIYETFLTFKYIIGWSNDRWGHNWHMANYGRCVSHRYVYMSNIHINDAMVCITICLVFNIRCHRTSLLRDHTYLSEVHLLEGQSCWTSATNYKHQRVLWAVFDFTGMIVRFSYILKSSKIYLIIICSRILGSISSSRWLLSP